jgi:hypothetical protein
VTGRSGKISDQWFMSVEKQIDRTKDVPEKVDLYQTELLIVHPIRRLVQLRIHARAEIHPITIR